LFDATGHHLPASGTDAAKHFPYSRLSIVIVRGVQMQENSAYSCRIGQASGTVAIAGLAKEPAVKRLGASQIIDRRSKDEDVRAQIRQLIGDDLLYVYDCANCEYTFAVSRVSGSKKEKWSLWYVVRYLRIASLRRRLAIHQPMFVEASHYDLSFPPGTSLFRQPLMVFHLP
jgi:hypothetical protein